MSLGNIPDYPKLFRGRSNKRLSKLFAKDFGKWDKAEHTPIQNWRLKYLMTIYSTWLRRTDKNRPKIPFIFR